MKVNGNSNKPLRRSIIAALAAYCLLPITAWSQLDENEIGDAENISVSSLDYLVSPGSFLTAPEGIASQGSAGLPFDTAGSETRKLELQLTQPLTLHAATSAMAFDNASGSILSSAGLGWTVTEELRLGASLNNQTNQFQALGSIHCENGVLDAGSYRASNCYFTNEAPGSSSTSTMNLGASYRINENVSAGVNMFRQSASAGSNTVGGAPGSGISIAGNRLTPGLNNGLQIPANGVLPGLIDSEVSGIDLEFRLGVSADSAGEMQFGLQFTRVLDAEFDTNLALQPGLTQWTLADPVDSARFSFDWQRNSFSGGIQGMYREPVTFLNRADTDATTMFDVYFSWRTPWNASLSVGASNLLNSGQDENKAADNNLADPFESVYGRIPYVRYQQDL